MSRNPKFSSIFINDKYAGGGIEITDIEESEEIIIESAGNRKEIIERIKKNNFGQ